MFLYIMIIMKMITAADLVWIATASLERENPARKGFSHDEIRQRVYAIEPEHGFPDATVRTHITTHCVANKKPDPGKHRKLYMNPDGTYRLYRLGDSYDSGRKEGKTSPDPNRIPSKYHALLEWYRTRDIGQSLAPEVDPILALQGVGKELWRELGGGEKFIRELRANWYGTEAPVRKSEAGARTKRKRAI
jgi:hypothetical protein